MKNDFWVPPTNQKSRFFDFWGGPKISKSDPKIDFWIGCRDLSKWRILMDFGEKSPIFSIFYLQKVKNGQFFPKITKNRHFGGPKKSKFEPLPRKFLTPFWTPQKPPKMAKNRVFLLFLVVFSTKITKNREIFEIFGGPPKFQILTKILKFLGPDQFTKIDLFLEIGVRGKMEIREFANFGTGRKKKFYANWEI